MEFHHVVNMPKKDDTTEVLKGHVEGTDVVVRRHIIGPSLTDHSTRGVEVCRVNLAYRSETATPENVRAIIAEKLPALLKEAREHGYRHCQEDMRRLLGLT